MKAISNINKQIFPQAIFGILIVVFALGCERLDEDIEPATFPNTAEVFIDEFSAGLEYAAFGDSKVTAFSVDDKTSYEGTIGTSSMRFDVPNEGDPEGSYAGGVFRDLGGRNLTGYNALTFYAKASKSGTVNLIGFGNDFEEDKFSTTASIKISTSWNKYIIPIPDPSKLTQEKGLFVIAAAPEDGKGYSIWLDVVKYEKLGTLAHPRPAILNGEDVISRTYIGITTELTGLSQTMNLPNGADQTVNTTASFFSFSSTDTTVAKVDGLGNVSVIGEGTAKITGKLAGEDAAGSLTIVSLGEFTHAPIPDKDPANVISIFSDFYTNVPVDFYNGFFEPFQTTKGGADIVIDGDNIIRYTDLNFVATQFSQPTVDASEMTHLHIDIQVEDSIQDGDFIKLELVDFGADGAFGGNDDTGGSITFNSPPLETGKWVGLDILLADFDGLGSTSNLAQILFVSDATISTILVDNMYFYDNSGSSGPPIPPTTPAPDPTEPASNVISIYSDSYTDVPNEGFNQYGAATFEEVQISGNSSLKYTFSEGDGGNFQVIELGGDNQIDAEAAGMTNFRFDLWFPNEVGGSSAFLMKLVDIPGSGPTEALINVSPSSTPEMVQGSWLQFDIPFTELENNGLGGKSNIQQVVIDLLSSGEVYVDNIYFYKDGGSACEDPTVAPPTPTQDAADVISVFSDAYTDIANTNFNPNWGQTTVVTTENIAGESTLKYDVFNFQGTNLGGADGVDQDLSSMEYLHIDMWTCDATVVEVTPISRSTGEKPVSLTPISNGQWNSYDIPLSDFTGVSMADIYQMKFDGQQGTTPSKIFVDNIYFYRTGGSSTGPTEAAPTPPSRDAADVVSIYSDAYSDIAFDNFDAGWCGGAAVTGVTIAGDNVLKKNAGIDCHGIDFSSGRQDLSAFTHIHFDFYTDDTDLTGDVFNVKLVDFAGGGSEVTNLQVNINTGTTPAIVAGSWVSVDVDITALGGVVAGDLTRSDIAQIGITTANLTNVWYDNIYFYKDGGSACEDPTVAPPTPTQDAADVISVFSDAYTDIANTNFNPNWGQTTVVTTESIAGESTLKYDVFNFQGTNLGGADGVDQDLSSMEYLHIDMWTCDATVVEVTPISRSTGEKPVSLTPISNGQWNSYDIPLSDFTGVSMADIYQMKFDGQQGTTPSKIFVDNIYFYRTGGSSTGPTEAAPTPPSRDAADVVSIYSDAYSDIAFDNFDAGWCGGAAVTGVTIAGDNVLKKNAGIDCHGIDFSSGRQDLSAFTHIHFDFYTDDTDLTGDVFNVKLVDFAGGNGEVSALEVNINTGTVPGIEAGVWVSVDIDITALGGVVAGSLTRSDIAQIGITTANLTNVWYDNIYLYK
jgi:hypothetical protein